MSLLGREPGGTPCPPRPLLSQLGALDSARLSCPVSVDSLHRGGTKSKCHQTQMLLGPRPLRWPRGGKRKRKRKRSSANASLPAPPCVGGEFSILLASRRALSLGGFELLGVVGSRGTSSPPAHSAGGTEAARVSPRASVCSARTGWGRGRGSGTPEEAGPFLPPVCSSKATRPLCPFSRGETCTQWWKTAAVPSFHWPGDGGRFWWALDGNALSGCGHPLLTFDELFRCSLVAHWPFVSILHA